MSRRPTRGTNAWVGHQAAPAAETSLKEKLFKTGGKVRELRALCRVPARQAVFGRLTGYEDVNDTERLRHDPAMRWIVGGKAASGCAASPSQMGRFEARWLTLEKNLSALVDLSGQWIDRVHSHRPPRGVVLDIGFKCESDAWRTRDERLERAL